MVESAFPEKTPKKGLKNAGPFFWFPGSIRAVGGEYEQKSRSIPLRNFDEAQVFALMVIVRRQRILMPTL